MFLPGLPLTKPGAIVMLFSVSTPSPGVLRFFDGRIFRLEFFGAVKR